MTDQNSLASLLDAHMKKASIGDARLAKQINTITDNSYFIHRSTLRNWRTGSAQKVNNWRQLVTVAVALQLNETEANNLLKSGGCPSIKALIAAAKDADQPLLSYWQNNSTNSSELPTTAGDIEGYSTQSAASRKHRLRSSDAAVPKAKVWKFVGAGIFAVGCIAALLSIVSGKFFHTQSNDASNNPTNLLINSQFNNGTQGWITYVNDAAFAGFKVDDEAMHIQIDQTAQKGWHITLNQKDLEVTGGKTYTARFRVRGDKATSFNVDITRVIDPKTSLSFDNSSRQTVAVSDNWITKTIGFEAIETISMDDGGARLLFKFGKSNKGWIEIDDIEFFEGQIGHSASEPDP